MQDQAGRRSVQTGLLAQPRCCSPCKFFQHVCAGKVAVQMRPGESSRTVAAWAVLPLSLTRPWCLPGTSLQQNQSEGGTLDWAWPWELEVICPTSSPNLRGSRQNGSMWICISQGAGLARLLGCPARGSSRGGAGCMEPAAAAAALSTELHIPVSGQVRRAQSVTCASPCLEQTASQRPSLQAPLESKSLPALPMRGLQLHVPLMQLPGLVQLHADMTSASFLLQMLLW